MARAARLVVWFRWTMKRALALLLLFGCAAPATRPVVCPTLPSGSIPVDAADLHQLIVAIRLRAPEPDPACSANEPCVMSCEEGTVCAACERLLVRALHQLSQLETDDAARAAAALVLDQRLGWDAGHALTLAASVARMKERVLPYLEPHVSTSRLADVIVDCIRRGDPCH